MDSNLTDMISYSKRRLFLVLGVLLSVSLSAQLVVESDQTVEWYVENVLLGGGVSVSNITFNGLPADQVNVQCGFFNSENANVGMESGLILSSGGVGPDGAFSTGAVGPNTSGSTTTPVDQGVSDDPDLVAISGENINDAAILEFDFVPTGDTLRFNYVFASEEYPEYVNSFNDAFGFFLAGPGLAGPYSAPAGFPDGSTNIALVPGTTIPVTIDNVNNGNDGQNGPCVNCEYYIHNGDGWSAPYDSDSSYIQYDGLTVVLEAFALVQCGETYHIKLAIGDALDSAFDSAVFLQEGSFQSSLSISAGLFSSIGPNTQGVLYENCGFGILEFTRSNGIEDEALVEIEVTGVAENGVDFTNIPDSFIFPAGDSVFTITVEAILDGIIEGNESAFLSITNTSASDCSGSITSEFEFLVSDDPEPLAIEVEDGAIDCGESINIAANVTGGYGQYEYAWSNGATTQNLDVSPGFTSEYVIIVTDTCNAGSVSDSLTITVPVYPPVEVDIADTTGLICLEGVVLSPLSVSGGDGTYSYQWAEAGQVLSEEDELDFVASSSTQLILTVTDGCGAQGDDVMYVDVPDIPISLTISPDTTICLDSGAEVKLTASGGEPPYEIIWSNGLTDVDSIYVTPIVSTQYAVTVRDLCNTEEEISMDVLVSETEAGFIWNQLDYNGVEVKSTSSTSNADTLFHVWSLGDGTFMEELEFTHMYQDNDDHVVSLQVINELGCMDSTSIVVEGPPLLYVPSSFTPNNDGVNDIFKPVGDGIVDYEMYIFDRWGRQLFFSEDIEDGWNGRGAEGSDHFAGNSSYAYRIRARMKDGERLDLQGFITIIR
jgi:gliding motility-associated-like protein